MISPVVELYAHIQFWRWIVIFIQHPVAYFPSALMIDNWVAPVLSEISRNRGFWGIFVQKGWKFLVLLVNQFWWVFWVLLKSELLLEFLRKWAPKDNRCASVTSWRKLRSGVFFSSYAFLDCPISCPVSDSLFVQYFLFYCYFLWRLWLFCSLFSLENFEDWALHLNDTMNWG